jgi:uncharacterized protein YfiM (DUF2279 family)
MNGAFLTIVFLSLPIASSGHQHGYRVHNDLSTYALTHQQDYEDPWLGNDKFLHLFASAGITWFSYDVYHRHYHNAVDRSIYFSFSLASASGIGKELYDAKIRKAGWSWKDIAADGVGIALGYLLSMHFDK